MCFGAGIFRTWAMIGRSPIMCFDFGGLKYRKDSQQSFLNQSTGTSEPWELRGAVLRIPNFHFLEGPIVRGGHTCKRGSNITIGDIKGDTRSLDYSSLGSSKALSGGIPETVNTIKGLAARLRMWGWARAFSIVPSPAFSFVLVGWYSGFWTS